MQRRGTYNPYYLQLRIFLLRGRRRVAVSQSVSVPDPERPPNRPAAALAAYGAALTLLTRLANGAPIAFAQPHAYARPEVPLTAARPVDLAAAIAPVAAVGAGSGGDCFGPTRGRPAHDRVGDAELVRARHGRQAANDCSCPKSAGPGGAAEAAALVLATQEFVANGGGRPSRRRWSAASPGRTGSLGRVGQRGLVAFHSQLSPPRRQTSEFSGGCGGLAPPARRLVLVRSRSQRHGGRIWCSPIWMRKRCRRRRSGEQPLSESPG